MNNERGNEMTMSVAVRNHFNSRQGTTEFKSQIQFLCQLRHPNICSLVGYCLHKKYKILVHEYMSNGSLDRHLHGGTSIEPLSWQRRLEICIGAARGLHYLHSGAKYVIVQRGINSRNILLDENWIPKIANFGVSIRGPLSVSKKPIKIDLESFVGTVGYIAPECHSCLELTEKSDVFSFGILLLEVLCARRPFELLKQDEENLSWQVLSVRDQIHLVFERVRQGDIPGKLDPYLVGKIAPECLLTYVNIAERCVDYEMTNRPAMGEVEVELEHALRLHLTADGFNEGGNSNNEIPS